MFTLWRIAVRDLGRNKRRSGLTLLAVAMGLALVITLHGFEMGAMQGSVTNSIHVQTGHLQVRADSYDADKVSLQWEDLVTDPLGVVERAQGLAEVRSAAPVLWVGGILSTVEESVGVRVFGIEPHSEMAAPFREGLVAGQFLAPDDRRGVLISQRSAESLGLAAGDDVSLLINTSGEHPDEATFTIRGLYHTGFPGFDESTIFLPLAKAQAFARVGERASAVVLLMHDREQADTVAAKLSAPGLQLLTWRDLNYLIVEAMNSAMGFLYMIYLIVLAVVAVVVANTLVMSVFERTREMGILAALGMKGRQIMGMPSPTPVRRSRRLPQQTRPGLGLCIRLRRPTPPGGGPTSTTHCATTIRMPSCWSRRTGTLEEWAARTTTALSACGTRPASAGGPSFAMTPPACPLARPSTC